MSKSVKSKIIHLLEGIEDEAILSQVMENVAFYSNTKDITDNLTKAQIEELDLAIKETNNKKTIPLQEFKKEMNEWRKK